MHDLVIFDCDGVLVDSEVISNQAIADNLARYGLHLTLSECMALFVGGTIAGVAAKVRTLGVDLPKDWVDEIYSDTYARLREGVPLVNGIPELLTALDASGIAYCVASNGSPEKMQITLGQNGLWEKFSGAMFSAHTLGVSKPDPDMFLLAADQFGANSPVVVEDSANGVTAAIRANMRCIGYAEHDDGGGPCETGGRNHFRYGRGAGAFGNLTTSC